MASCFLSNFIGIKRNKNWENEIEFEPVLEFQFWNKIGSPD